MSSGKKTALFITVAALAVATYIAAVAFLNPDSQGNSSGNTEEIAPYPAYDEVYGLLEGDIVKLSLANGNTTTTLQHSADSQVIDATRSENYTAYVTVEDKFYKLRNDSGAEPEKLETEAPSYYTLKALKDDAILYGIPKSKPVISIPEDEGEEYPHHEEHSEAEPHDIFYSEINILQLTEDESEPEALTQADGSELEAHLFDVSPNRELIVASNIGGDAYLYSYTGELIEELSPNISKIGFLTDDIIWFSDVLGSDENADQHIKLLNIETGEIEDLYDRNEEFSKISLLDFRKVGNRHILLGNSYKTGSAQQSLFEADKELTSLEGLATLSSLSLNSDGDIIPIPDGEYLIAVRSSNNKDEKATFRLSTVSEEGSVYSGVSGLFAPPFPE